VTDVFTDAALDFVRRHRSRPFYLHLAYSAPHFPLMAPAEMVHSFEQAGHSTGVATVYAMVEAMDRGIGRLLALLDELRLTRRTIVHLCSDNGPQLNRHHGSDLERFTTGLRGEKGEVFEGGIRVPGLLRWPDELPAGLESSLMVHFCDWMPTLLAATPVRLASSRLDGRDRLPEIRGDAPPDDQPRFWQWTRYRPERRANIAMREGRWKLVMPAAAGRQEVRPDDASRDEAHAARRPASTRVVPLRGDEVAEFDPVPPMLFDLEADPDELRDLALAHPERVAAMTCSIDEWWDDVHRVAAA
jgi:arylsulfatase A